MKKTLCTILAVCTLGTGLVSCSKKAEEGYRKVESETCDFYFECPESWEITHTNGMLSAINPKDVSKANVTAYAFPHGLDTAPSSLEYWQVYKNKLSEVYVNCEFEEANALTLGGHETAHAKYTVTLGEDVFDCETVLFVYGNKAYTITLTQGAKNDEIAENYNDHSDEFSEIIKTFRIK